MASAWFESLQSPRTGGEIMKLQFYWKPVVRGTFAFVVTAAVTLLLLVWTQQSIPLQSVSWPTEARRSVAAPLTQPACGDDSNQLADFVEERGVGLLHTWTDEELFQKAVSFEQSRALANQFNLTNSMNSTVSAQPKIAFMFLTVGEIPLAPFWNKFFEGHEDLYNIYVHMWPLTLNKIRKSDGVFWGRLVPSYEGLRLTPGLISSARRLLANALVDDFNNQYFALVSETCLPLHGFPHIYQVITASNKTIMELDANHWDLQARYVARGEDAMKPEIEYSQFRISSQFWIMKRMHAVMTVNDTIYWNKFNQPCVPEHVSCYPEEHYFPTLLNILDAEGCTNYCATHVDWSHTDGGHPRMYWESETNTTLIQLLQNTNNGQYLFARKFADECLTPLMSITDSILLH